MHENTTTKLAHLISRRLAVLEELRDLAKRQLALIDSGDTPKLLALLAVKQERLGLLQAIDAQLDPFRPQDPEQRVWSSPEARAACRAEAETCQELLREVIQLEQQAEQQVTRERDEVARRLDSAGTASAASHSYSRVRAASPAARDLPTEA